MDYFNFTYDTRLPTLQELAEAVDIYGTMEQVLPFIHSIFQEDIPHTCLKIEVEVSRDRRPHYSDDMVYGRFGTLASRQFTDRHEYNTTYTMKIINESTGKESSIKSPHKKAFFDFIGGFIYFLQQYAKQRLSGRLAVNHLFHHTIRKEIIATTSAFHDENHPNSSGYINYVQKYFNLYHRGALKQPFLSSPL